MKKRKWTRLAAVLLAIGLAVLGGLPAAAATEQESAAAAEEAVGEPSGESESETEAEEQGAPISMKIVVVMFFVGMFAMVGWTGFTFLRRFDEYADIDMVFGRRRKR